MEVETKTQGLITVDDKQRLEFPEGLFGFEGYTEFVIFDAEYKPFIWLQSTQDKSLAFLVVDPFLICSDYELDIDDKLLAKIGIESPTDVFVLFLLFAYNALSLLTSFSSFPKSLIHHGFS